MVIRRDNKAEDAERALKRLYDRVLDEPVPDHLLRLLDELAEKYTGDGNDTAEDTD